MSDQATIRAAQIGMRATIVGAIIAAVASLITSGVGLATELGSDDSAGTARVEQAAEASTGSPGSCVRSLDAVMDFVKEHPRAGRVYARAGRSGMPRLAAEDVIAACGDPETLVEEAGVPRRR